MYFEGVAVTKESSLFATKKETEASAVHPERRAWATRVKVDKRAEADTVQEK